MINHINDNRHKMAAYDVSIETNRRHNLLFIETLVELLERRDFDRHGLGSKSTRAILFCLWERHFTCLVLPAW